MSVQERKVLSPHLYDLVLAGEWQKLHRIKSTIARLFTASARTYDYSHHASLGCDLNGLYAFWSNGCNGEDLPGQVQSWCRCDADGRWGTPQVLARAPMFGDRTTTAINGGTAVGSACLTSFYSEFKGRPKDGAGGSGKWSLPMYTGAQVHSPITGAWSATDGLLEDYLLNEGPRRTQRGRWLMTGENHDGHTRIAYCDEDQPSGMGWKVVPVAKGAGDVFKNEPSWFQRPDGTIALWLRDDGGTHRLWLAESADEGTTWTEPVPTDMPDATSKCHAGRLSNGLYYLIFNPNPSGLRIPLALALSHDSRAFTHLAILRDELTEPRLPGRFKGPGYQYPNSLELDGVLYIIYSVNKEEVEVQSISVADIAILTRQI